MSNCINCQDNCLGNEIPINCFYDEETGKSLISLLKESSSRQSAQNNKITISSDDIVSSSLMRSQSYICASQIIKRDFVYGIASTVNNVTFSWDFLPVISVLPSGFRTALTKVKITGNSQSGANLLAESKTPSGGIPINLTNFPISVDINVRLTSPCGNVDLISQFSIYNPAINGEFRTNFDAMDLNPQSGKISLTQQLNSLEAQLSSSKYELEVYKTLINEMRLDIEKLKSHS